MTLADKETRHVREEEQRVKENAERAHEAFERLRLEAEDNISAGRSNKSRMPWRGCVLQFCMVQKRHFAASFCPLLEQDILRMRQSIEERKRVYKEGGESVGLSALWG
eukprot:symbB.v1.2.014080.t1/scaffold1011.1/size144341/10